MSERVGCRYLVDAARPLHDPRLDIVAPGQEHPDRAPSPRSPVSLT